MDIFSCGSYAGIDRIHFFVPIIGYVVLIYSRSISKRVYAALFICFVQLILYYGLIDSYATKSTRSTQKILQRIHDQPSPELSVTKPSHDTNATRFTMFTTEYAEYSSPYTSMSAYIATLLGVFFLYLTCIKERTHLRIFLAVISFLFFLFANSMQQYIFTSWANHISQLYRLLL